MESVAPLTLQVVGVQVSNATVSALLAGAVTISAVPLAAVAGGAKLIDWPLRMATGIKRLVRLLSSICPSVLSTQYLSPPTSVNARLCVPPALITATQPLRAATSTGVKGCDTAVSPVWP